MLLCAQIGLLSTKSVVLLYFFSSHSSLRNWNLTWKGSCANHPLHLGLTALMHCSQCSQVLRGGHIDLDEGYWTGDHPKPSTSLRMRLKQTKVTVVRLYKILWFCALIWKSWFLFLNCDKIAVIKKVELRLHIHKYRVLSNEHWFSVSYARFTPC